MNDIVAPGPDRLPRWTAATVNLASARLGAKALSCSDDSFAAMGRMLQDGPAVFKPDAYDDFGKWMDGWESKRRRDGGHDWCLVALGARGEIAGFDVDTSHFTGNYPPAFAVFASDAAAPPDPDSRDWTAIVPSTNLGPSAHHLIACERPGPWRWLKLAIYPDGGVARLRVYGRVVPDFSGVGAGGEVELSALANGGRIVAYNDAHYGTVEAILTAGRGRDMGDGWETRRRREPGNDWLIGALGAAGVVTRVEIDTAHYKGNFPDRCSLQAAQVTWGTDASAVTQAMFWPELMAEQHLRADTVHVFEGEALRPIGPVTHVKLNIFPDGGISRLRVFGHLA